MPQRILHRRGKLALVSLMLAVSALPSCLRSQGRMADTQDKPAAQPVVAKHAGPEGAAPR